MVHVIVGGLGSLGRVLQKQLLSKGKTVRVIDLAPSAQAAANGLAHPTSVDYVASSPDTLPAALKGAETVYNLAAPNILKGTAADCQRINVDAVQDLLKVCKEVGVNKFVHASTMRVTNQLLDHVQETEETPLPALDTYQIPYDRTKRLGESLVLEAGCDKMQTCSLRLGSILASQGDYVNRFLLDHPGRIMIPRESAKCDYVSVNDAAFAFISASNKMDCPASPINGQAIYVTKCKNNKSPRATEVLEKFAEHLNWRPILVQRFAVEAAKGGYRLAQSAKNMFSSPTDEETPGYPLDLKLEAVNHELTFDNSLAHRLLDYNPEETWEDAVLNVSKELREHNPEFFNKHQVHWE